MRLFHKHLDSECERLTEAGVRLSVIGRRDRLPDSLRRKIEQVEERTRAGTALHLRIAIDYSAREALFAAARRLAEGAAEDAAEDAVSPPTRAEFERQIAHSIHASGGSPDVDLLIRTSGEQRLSDFLLWESAYAELVFTEVLWPDFGHADLVSALQTFARRDRRFGGLSRSASR